MVVLSLLLAGCQDKSPIVIGFSATLSGNNSEIGVQEMYGVELAVQKINQSGGINGRELILKIEDDLNSSITAVNADNKLINEGAVAIIGHGFSSVAEATVANANEKDYLLISPSIGTDSLTGINDNFIRLVPTATYEAHTIASLMAETSDKPLMIVYDEGNSALTDYHNQSFQETVAALDREYVSYGFSSGNIEDYQEVISLIETNDIDSVFVVGSSLDASNLIQLTINEELEVDYHLSAWASSGDVLHRVGFNEEHVTLYNFYNANDMDDHYLEVKTAFHERYGVEMSMVASYAYDAMMMLADALSEIEEITTETIKNKIIQTNIYDGVQSPFLIDMYGDVKRNIYQFVIIDGEIVNKN